jgi:Cu-processing system permease protein
MTTRPNESLRRIAVVAREEYRRALETRWLFVFSMLFALLVLGLSYFGLAQSREVGFQGFARVTLSLMNLVLIIVPLTGLMLGVTSIAGGGESLALLLAQPVSRGEVLAGKFLGLAAALGIAQALGFGGGGVVVALNGGIDQVPGFPGAHGTLAGPWAGSRSRPRSVSPPCGPTVCVPCRRRCCCGC